MPFDGLARVRGWNIDPAFGLAITIIYGAALIFLLVRARMRYRALPELMIRASSGTTPDCMVVIPARNEGGVIDRAVRSLPPDTVIVVDDGSTDATVVEAEEAGAGVLRAPKLPRGAIGKPHACMVGARAIDAKWILFADADTWYDKGWVESVVAAAEANGLSFLSVYLKQEPNTFAGRMLLPYAQALFFSGIDPTRSPDGAFCGQCILVRREAYEFIGGHHASLTFLADDLKLAGLALRHRMKLGLARTRQGHTRDRESWRGLWHKVVRNSQRFSLLPGSYSIAALATILLGTLWIPVVLLAYVSGWLAAAVGVAVLPFLLLLPWYRNAFRALAAPLALYAMLPVAGHALYCVWTSRKVQWKGREV